MTIGLGKQESAAPSPTVFGLEPRSLSRKSPIAPVASDDAERHKSKARATNIEPPAHFAFALPALDGIYNFLT